MKQVAFALIMSFAICSGVLMIVAVTRTEFPLAVNSTTNEASDLTFVPHPGTQLPLATTLIDENGSTVTLGDYFSKSPAILVLEYLRCTSLCGLTLRNLVLDGLAGLPLQPGRDYQLLAISIDPRDQPADAAAARAKYAALLDRKGGETGMHFLLGSASAVRKIADAVGFPYRLDTLLDFYIHPAGFIVAAPDGVISSYFEGVAISPPALIAAFANAEEDKSHGPLTRLLLLCHAQGARLGRYTVPVLAAFTIANFAAAFTLIVVFTTIRRRRHG